jgi:hypothetical protein
LQLDFISVDAWQAFGELCLHRDVILCYLAVGQTNDLKHRCIYIEGIVARRRLLDEGTDPGDDDGAIAALKGKIERLRQRNDSKPGPSPSF